MIRADQIFRFWRDRIASAAFLLMIGSAVIWSQEPGPIANTPPDIESLTLNRDTVYLKCHRTVKQECDEHKSQLVEINTVVLDKENNPVIITYVVKTGRIVGQGPRVYWDLSEAMPGTHSVTAYADDGGGPRGLRVTKDVTVEACTKCGPACECVWLRIAPSQTAIAAGEIITFTVSTVDSKAKYTGPYSWSISAGTIIEGQGTPQIKVKTTAEMAGSEVRAMMENAPSDNCTCENHAMSTVWIAAPKTR